MLAGLLVDARMSVNLPLSVETTHSTASILDGRFFPFSEQYLCPPNPKSGVIILHKDTTETKLPL